MARRRTEPIRTPADAPGEIASLYPFRGTTPAEAALDNWADHKRMARIA